VSIELLAALPDYEDRPQQRAMAAAVARAFEADTPLIVEAGTGTGKTFAYLIPALRSRRKVVVSTGTRTLQEQILERDVPALRRLLDEPFEVAVLKGVSNYLCVRRLREHGSLFDGDELHAIRAWAARTATGDRAELADIPDDAAVWRDVTTTPEARLGPRCPHHRECFVTRARRQAEKAQLIIVNHHLFFADLALRASYPGARVLPDYDAVVLDEAHQVEEIATEYFGVSASTRRFGALERDARRALAGASVDKMIDHVDRAATALFDDLRPRLRGERAAIPDDLFAAGAVQKRWFAVDTALDELVSHATLAAEGEQDDDRSEEIAAIARRGAGVRDDLTTIAEGGLRNYVHWAEVTGRAVMLRASPVDVAPLLSAHLFAPVPATVLTSATLTTGGRFDYVRSRLGLDGELAEELRVDSPFDYATQALLYVPDDLPDPREPGFAAASCERIRALLELSRGRAFVLFTSHRALRAAVATLNKNLPFPVLVQGEQPRAALLARFRATANSVLFATGAFWEGVDVPGDALSMVIMDKLPFAPPADPLVEARMARVQERGGDPFSDYQVPHAALALKQGFGRLIRRRDDRGVVAVLDGRVHTRRYGRAFLDTLPDGVRDVTTLAGVAAWWRDQEPPAP
jgi:ATP-dependent DNA helicase DinG